MTDRTRARVVGALFIVASATAIAGGTLILPAVDTGFLVEAADHSGRIVTGALLEIVLALSVVGIAVTLYPVLERQGKGSAMAYVAVRTLEGIVIVGTTLSALTILTLSRDHGSDTTAAAAGSAARLVGDMLVAAREWGYRFGPLLMFSVSTLLLYPALRRGHLVPVWLSTWGLVGGVLLAVRSVGEMYHGALPLPLEVVLTAPIGVNEMVLAGYLLIRGFTAPDQDPVRAGVLPGPRRAGLVPGSAPVAPQP